MQSEVMVIDQVMSMPASIPDERNLSREEFVEGRLNIISRSTQAGASPMFGSRDVNRSKDSASPSTAMNLPISTS